MPQTLTVYKASAGSGKTYTLAREYIMQLIENPDPDAFKHILAVTFTNKATAEMKGRIVEKLWGLANDAADDYMGDIREKYGYDEDLIKARAASALSAILHGYSDFRVETIDAFFQSILRNMARELGLSANLQVELGTEEVISQAVDKVIDSMDEDPNIREWVLQYVHEQLESGEKWDIATPLKAFAKQIFLEDYLSRTPEEQQRISDNVAVKGFKDKMYAIQTQCLADAQAKADALTAFINGSLLNFDHISHGNDWLRGFIQKARILESEGPNATIINWSTGEADLFKSKEKDAVKAAAPAVRTALAQFIADYAGIRCDYLSAKLALKHLNKLRLLVKIDEQIGALNNANNNFCLALTPVLLKEMIDGCDTPFIFEKIGTKIKYVMIDEFQDTSRMQWENFKTILFEQLAKDGKGLLVGDVKQSIYRWRSGDWRILHGIEDEMRQFHTDIVPLDRNFRSYDRVVKFNNRFFKAAADLLDPEQLPDIYKDVRQEVKKEDGRGYVSMTIYKYGKDEGDDYEERMIREMADVIRQLPPEVQRKSAILVRTHQRTQDLISAFGRYAPDIKLVSDEAFRISSSVAVQMIVDAMRLLIEPGNLVARTYLKLHYQHDVLGQTGITLHQIALSAPDELLPQEWADEQNELRQLPLTILTERLYAILSLNRIADQNVYLLTFMDELQKHLHGNAPDIHTFLDAWDEGIQDKTVPGSISSGIQIITIHKSKGLEFQTVLLPYCDWTTEADRQDDMLWCKSVDSRFADLGALPISIYSKDVASSVFSADYEREHMERRIDALNTLYVAFTRAGANLLAWGKTNKPKEDDGKKKKKEEKEEKKAITRAGELIYSTLLGSGDDKDDCFRYTEGTLTTCLDEKKEEKPNRLRLETDEQMTVDMVSSQPRLDFRQSTNATKFLEELKTEEGELIRLSQREVGIRMHEMLSRVEDADMLPQVIADCRHERLILEGKDWDRIVKSIEKGFRHPLVRSWFQPGLAVHNECAIATVDSDGKPQVLRPDRVISDGHTITVIDYKFGQMHDDYPDQVRAYMQRMQQMYPDKKVKGYLWFVMKAPSDPQQTPQQTPQPPKGGETCSENPMPIMII